MNILHSFYVLKFPQLSLHNVFLKNSIVFLFLCSTLVNCICFKCAIHNKHGLDWTGTWLTDRFVLTHYGNKLLNVNE